MGNVLTIASRDFKSFFTSVKGFAVFFFFLTFMGFFFQSFIGSFMQLQQQAMQRGGAGGVTLEQLVTALFSNIHFILILIVPAITMTTFAEEKKSHAIRLLFNAPVTSLQIVLGKFFACLGLMTLVLLAAMVYPGYLMWYGNPDAGVIMSSFLGVFLLIASQLAFGLWISSMTTNQLMAFTFTIAGLFLLLILNWIAPNLSKDGGVQEMIKYLASTEHLQGFLKGVISVKGIAYFLLFTCTFLFFTNVSLDSHRWR